MADKKTNCEILIQSKNPKLYVIQILNAIALSDRQIY